MFFCKIQTKHPTCYGVSTETRTQYIPALRLVIFSGFTFLDVIPWVKSAYTETKTTKYENLLLKFINKILKYFTKFAASSIQHCQNHRVNKHSQQN